MDNLFNIIKRPIISEKGTMLTETYRTYAFEVDKKCNKQEISQAVEKLFSVKVDKVRTMIVHGKVKTFGRKIFKRSNWKKALVTLKDGQKIELFQGV